MEDDAIVRSMLEKILRSEGFDASFAVNAKSGLQECARLKPNAVLLDVNLPDGNGIDVCRQMKLDARLCDIPVMILTGEAVSIEDRAIGLEAGADDYLLKPFDAQELVLRLKRLLPHDRRRS